MPSVRHIRVNSQRAQSGNELFTLRQTEVTTSRSAAFKPIIFVPTTDRGADTNPGFN